MRKPIFFLFVMACICRSGMAQVRSELLTRDQVGADNLPAEITPIKAPFEMPQLKRPQFPSLQVKVGLRKRDRSRMVTAQIQRAIDQVHGRGGGSVVIPEGEWHTGRLILKSNVNLHIPKGVVLRFSDKVEDYMPAVFTRSAGVEGMSTGAMIYAFRQRNIAVTGQGILYGPNMQSELREKGINYGDFDQHVAYDKPATERFYDLVHQPKVFSPTFIGPVDCRNVLIEGVTLVRSAFWNVVPTYCDSVIIRGVTVNSETPDHIPCGDGMDIESSRNVLIEYCTLETGDDGFTIKAGRGIDGLRVNRPTENVVIRYCLTKTAHGGVTCGSETAGMIRDLYVHDCVFDGSTVGIRFKTRRPRGGGGEDLYYERIRMQNLKGSAIGFDMLGSALYVGSQSARTPMPLNQFTPLYRNIDIRDIVIEGATSFLKVIGIPESPAMNVSISNVTSKTKELMILHDLNHLSLTDCDLSTTGGSQIDILDGRNMTFRNVRFHTPDGQVSMKKDGPLTENNRFINCVPGL